MSTINGTNGSDTLVGTAAADSISGLGGADAIDGALGNDTIDGGIGDDTLRGGFGNDSLIGGDGSDYLAKQLYQNSDADLGDDTLLGGAGNDFLYDRYGNNVLDGGDGNDVFGVHNADSGTTIATGGAGRDTYTLTYFHLYNYPNQNYGGPNAFEVTDFQTGAGGDLIDVGPWLLLNGLNYVGFPSGNPFNASPGFLRLVPSGPDTLLQGDLDGAAGSAYTWITLLNLQNVTTTSITSANFVGTIPPDGSVPSGLVITGTSGADVLTGQYFDDQLSGIDGNDTLDGSGGHDTLNGDAGNDQLTGGLGNDSLVGGADNDYFADQFGNNVMLGGGGDDRFKVSSLDSGANAVTGGTGQDQYEIAYTFSAGYDYAVTDFAVGAGGDLLDVDELLDVSGLIGGYGGGNPFSSFLRLVQTGPDTVLQWDKDGAETLYAWVPLITLQNVAPTALTADNFVGGIPLDGSSVPGQVVNGTDSGDTLNGGFFDDQLFGFGGFDWLYGKGGNDLLEGGPGGDVLDGGFGNDTQFGGAGSDSFFGDYYGDDTLVGGEGDDFFRDFSGNNVLDGGDGIDRFDIGGFFAGDISANTIIGGAGRDHYEFRPLKGSDLNFRVTDFAVGSNGDLLDVDQLLGSSATFGGYSGGNPFELGYLRLIQSGGDALLQWDVDGQGASLYGWATQLTLQNVAATTITSHNFVGQLIVGTEADDSLVGGLGDDTILGAGGNDTIDGGPGDNIVQGDAGLDVALLPGTLADYTVSILSPGQDGRTFYDLGSGLAAGDIVALASQNGRVDRLFGIEKVRFLGNPTTTVDDVEFDVTPTGLLQSAALNRGENYQADSNGANSLVGGAGNDVLDGLGGSDTLQGEAGNDVLLGGVGNDSLEGGAGNDALNGGVGNDTLIGGAGNDNYIVDAAGDVVIEQAAAGSTDRVQSQLATYSLAVLPEIEVLEFIGGGAFHGTGNVGANRVLGKIGADTLIGGAGADTLLGAGGNDILDGGLGNDSIDGGTGTDVAILAGNSEAYTFEPLVLGVRVITIATGESDLLISVERARFANGSENVLTNLISSEPTSLNDLISGTNGNDTIDALAGSDTVSGGGGNDSLLGGTGDDRLDGGAGNDTLDGGTGNDLLIGGAGNDRFYVDSPGDFLVEALAGTSNGFADTALASVSFVLGANLENLVLLDGFGNLNGAGNALANLITGNDGNNRLDGGAGADTLTGGAGNDVYVVDQAGDRVIEAVAGGTDRVESTFGFVLSPSSEIEQLVLTGSLDANGTGNALHNVLTGNAGANVLNGGAGNDTLAGGRGDDTYVVDSAGDVLQEFSGQGRDTVITPFSTVLAAPFENLFLSEAASVNATGNAAGNVLRGNAGNNVLDGAGGLDTMDGGAGNDTYVIDRLLEQGLISDSSGIDTVVSNAQYTALAAGLENLTLTGNAWIGLGNGLANTISGNARANVLIGGAGNDTLIGGAGADLMDGGLGADRFVFDTTPGTGNRDIVVDFSAAQGDRIVLDNDIFTALLTPGPLSAEAFRAGAGVKTAADADDRIVFDTASGAFYYDADGNGGAAAVQLGTIFGSAGIGAASFEVVD